MSNDGRDSERDVDAAFAEIVSRWDDIVSAPDIHEETPQEQPGDPASSAAPAVPEMPWPVWRGAVTPHPPVSGAAPDVDDEPDEAHDDDDEHFVPGPTAPLPPQEDLHFWGIIVGLVGGPLLLLWLVLFRPDVSSWWALLAVGLSLGGFVLLVLRQPRHRSDDDPDDGARL